MRWMFWFLMLLVLGCSEDGNPWKDVDTDSDTDSETDADTDSDSDSDTDTDTDTDTETETDTSECLEGSYEIENSMDIAPLLPFTCVTGNLTIIAPGLTNLELPNLEWVGGDLTVQETALTSLEGLETLEAVGGWLLISHNEAITSLEGLGAITTLGGLGISVSDAMTSLGGLNSLVSVDEELVIHQTSLTSLDELDSLVHVGLSVSIAWNYDLPQCEACDLLEHLDGFTGDIFFDNNQPDTCTNICE